MAKVVANMSMSLDGFVSHPASGTRDLFGWYFGGDVQVPTAAGFTFQVTSQASAAQLRDALAGVGALVTGRRTFDKVDGWGGTHPVGVPAFVVTHSVPDGWPRPGGSMVFVTDGVESAIRQAKAVAGDKDVAVATPDITQQCLNAGLLDELRVDLIPVLLGDGVRFFDNLAKAPVVLDGPRVVEGVGVTHLLYRVTSR